MDSVTNAVNPADRPMRHTVATKSSMIDYGATSKAAVVRPVRTLGFASMGEKIQVMQSKPGEPEPHLIYVRDMLEQLKVVSGAAPGSVLLYLLDMAQLEIAHQISDGHRGQAASRGDAGADAGDGGCGKLEGRQ